MSRDNESMEVIMFYVKRMQIVLIVFLLIPAFGCAKKAATDDERVIAKINNFELQASDFKEALDPALMKYYTVEDKEQLLEMLISKEILLQEAQKLDLDKEKAFMKEVEGYWEQALLKSLINRKLEELSGKVKVDDDEVLKEYSRLKRRVQAELVIFSDKASAEKLSKSGPGSGEARLALKDKIVSEVPLDWYTTRDLPTEIEGPLFTMKPGELSAPIEYNKSWIVLKVVGEEENKVGPLEELKGRIREDILRTKKQELLEAWSADLRRKANIRVNREALEAIDLK